MVLFAVEASAGSSGRPCGVYMFSGLTTLVFYIIMLHSLRTPGHENKSIRLTK